MPDTKPTLTGEIAQTDEFLAQVQETADRMKDDVNNQFTHPTDQRSFRATVISLAIVDLLTEFPENTGPFVELIAGSLAHGIAGGEK